MSTNRPTPVPGFLARVYQFERDNLVARVLGGAYALPPCWHPGHDVWRKLVAFTGDRGVDPVRYIRWSLELAQVGYPPDVPEPNRLLERARMDFYKADAPAARRRLADAFECEKVLALRTLVVAQRVHGLAATDAQLRAATDRELSPLFRYALARSIGGERMTKVVTNREPEALFQFSCYPKEYAALYAPFEALPAGFAGRAARHYARVVEENTRGREPGGRA